VQLQPGRHEQVAQHREGEVAARQFDHRQVAVVALLAQEGELVLVETLAFQRAGAREQHARLADQVERHIGQRDVFFEHRAVAAPLAQALAQDQGRVAQAQQVVDIGRWSNRIEAPVGSEAGGARTKSPPGRPKGPGLPLARTK
jgi:hypothetical protein